MSLVRTRSVPFLRPIWPCVDSIFFWRSAARAPGEAPVRGERQRRPTAAGGSTAPAMSRRRRMDGAGGYVAAACAGRCTPALQRRLRKPEADPAILSGIMRNTSFGRDTGLQARMLLTMFLLGARLRRVHRRAVRRRRQRRHDRRHRAAACSCCSSSPPTSSRCAPMGAREVSPAGGARAARDDRAPVRPGRPAQAAGRVMQTARCPTRSRWAARRRTPTVCATTGIMDLLSPAELEGVMAHELTPRRQPRRDDHDARELLRRRSPSMIVQFGFFFGGGFGGGTTTTTTARRSSWSSSSRCSSTRLVLPDAGALALPRVRGRPRLGDHHRPPERAGLGAAEDQRRRWSASPSRTCARHAEHERLLHLPAAAQEVARQPVLDAPAAREAHRGACSGSRPSCRAAAAPASRVAA